MPMPRTRVLPVAAVLVAGVALAACGSAAAGTASGASAPAASPAAGRVGPVTTVMSNVTAQMLAATGQRSSTSHEAVFTLTARTASGAPAAHQPVGFWVGPMVPLSGVHPAHWYQAGSSTASAYVASFTATTDAAGQARIVLLGQPAASMEMVAVRIGNLDSFDAAQGHGLGLLDAWWTTPSIRPTAPVGDTVVVTPFLAATRPGQRQVFQVRVDDPAGAPVLGAGVQFIPQHAAGAMSGGTAAAVKADTDSRGIASYTTGPSARGSMAPLRVVVTQPSSTARIAGGMAGESISAK